MRHSLSLDIFIATYREGHLYCHRKGIWAENASLTNFVIPFMYYPKPNLCLDSSLSTQSLSFFVLSTPHKFTVSLSKSVNTACFGHFLGPISIRPPFVSFSLLIHLVSVLLQAQPQEVEGGNSLLPQQWNHGCWVVLVNYSLK